MSLLNYRLNVWKTGYDVIQQQKDADSVVNMPGVHRPHVCHIFRSTKYPVYPVSTLATFADRYCNCLLFQYMHKISTEP